MLVLLALPRLFSGFQPRRIIMTKKIISISFLDEDTMSDKIPLGEIECVEEVVEKDGEFCVETVMFFLTFPKPCVVFSKF